MAIIVANGVCQTASGTDLGTLALPDTVQGVITSRIDQLQPAQQLALKVASVIGRVFAFHVLRGICPIEEDKAQLPDYLDTLRRLDLTSLYTPEPDLAYIFKHVITQEVAYNMLLFAQRRQLHHAIAEWYEHTYADDLGPFYPILAHHWSKAEVESKTIEYLEKAGEQALNNGAYQEALLFFSEALTLDARAEPVASHPRDRLRRGHWERQLAEAYWGLGNPAEGREHLQRSPASFRPHLTVTPLPWTCSYLHVMVTP